MDPVIAADFQTLAQIAITLTGFTGIIGVIQTRGGNALAGPEASLIVTLITVSALVVFAAFIPSSVALLTGNEPDIWKWSFRVLLAAHLVAWITAVPFMLRAGTFFEKFPEPQRTISRAFASLGILAVVAELVVVLGHQVAYSAFVFQSVLIVLIAIAFFSFVSLMFALNR